LDSFAEAELSRVEASIAMPLVGDHLDKFEALQTTLRGT
jgi:hypothetical protein